MRSRLAAPPILAPEQSTLLRERLIEELSAVQTTDDAADWAQRSLSPKNTLAVDDAQAVEAAFAARVVFLDQSQLSAGLIPAHAKSLEAVNTATPNVEAPVAVTSPARRGRVAAKTIRLRDKEHRKFVATQPCLVCGRTPADAHHLRFAQPRAVGRKVSDEFTVPLCRTHHRELHRQGDEAAWWSSTRVDPMPIASKLWNRTRNANAG